LSKYSNGQGLVGYLKWLSEEHPRTFARSILGRLIPLQYRLNAEVVARTESVDEIRAQLRDRGTLDRRLLVGGTDVAQELHRRAWVMRQRGRAAGLYVRGARGLAMPGMLPAGSMSGKRFSAALGRTLAQAHQHQTTRIRTNGRLCERMSAVLSEFGGERRRRCRSGRRAAREEVGPPRRVMVFKPSAILKQRINDDSAVESE
jgi:hypothetical protein